MSQSNLVYGVFRAFDYGILALFKYREDAEKCVEDFVKKEFAILSEVNKQRGPDGPPPHTMEECVNNFYIDALQVQEYFLAV